MDRTRGSPCRLIPNEDRASRTPVRSPRSRSCTGTADLAPATRSVSRPRHAAAFGMEEAESSSRVPVAACALHAGPSPAAQQACTPWRRGRKANRQRPREGKFDADRPASLAPTNVQHGCDSGLTGAASEAARCSLARAAAGSASRWQDFRKFRPERTSADSASRRRKFHTGM